ncbi:hypothetical protein BYT27DRAFT_7013901, partial [Phlegmacium glaucopus]
PLDSPPAHLLNDPSIQSTLLALHDFIHVETPFNVNHFESMLYDHPNQPFVKSVMNSLQYGFWPFDEGNWEDDHDNPIQNYATEQADIDAIHAFHNDEIQACRWSAPLDSNVLPGMKISPIFVIWQKEKARVVTDHTADMIEFAFVRLNDFIPRSEAKVHYDNMQTFGQVI